MFCVGIKYDKIICSTNKFVSFHFNKCFKKKSASIFNIPSCFIKIFYISPLNSYNFVLNGLYQGKQAEK